jgi:hypothetical protein
MSLIAFWWSTLGDACLLLGAAAIGPSRESLAAAAGLVTGIRCVLIGRSCRTDGEAFGNPAG